MNTLNTFSIDQVGDGRTAGRGIAVPTAFIDAVSSRQ